MERITKPWYGNDFLFRLFPIGREHDKLLGTLHTFTENVGPNKMLPLFPFRYQICLLF